MRMLPISIITLISVLLATAFGWAETPNSVKRSLRVGWAMADITPPRPVSLVGFFEKRISTGLRDPLTATALALEAVGPDGRAVDQAILVSCDTILIRRALQDSVKRLLQPRLTDFNPDKLVLHATHTHQGPLLVSGASFANIDVTPAEQAKGVMTGDECAKLFVERVAEAAAKAWNGRSPGGMSWALDQAVVGADRRFVYLDGHAQMLRPINTPTFDCVEGVEDHGLSLLFFWDPQKKLTGLVANVACPAQSDQGGTLISADFWHDVRDEIGTRHGKQVFVCGQCGAGGDMYPMPMFRYKTEQAMAKRKGIPWRRELGRRIADGVDRVLGVAKADIEFGPVVKHVVARVSLPLAPASVHSSYPCDPVDPAEIHVIRLGDAAVVTNPFELFVDYGIRIQARSKALITFNINLACQFDGYLPTARALRGGGYSADKYYVGPEGGRILVDECIKQINALWP